MSSSSQKFAVKSSVVEFETPVPTNGTRSKIVKFDTAFKLNDDTMKESPLPPLKLKSQCFAMINVCHRAQKPRHLHPGFRIIGVFDTRAEALLFANEHATDMSATNVFIVPTHEPFPLCISEKSQIDSAACAEIRTRLLDVYAKYVETTDTEFSATRKENDIVNLSAGEADNRVKSIAHIQSQRKRVSPEEQESLKGQLPALSTVISSSLSIQHQQCAVVINVPDLTDSPISQPLVAVLAVFGTSDEAIRYAKFVAQKHYPKLAIDVVDVQRWYHPDAVDTNSLNRSYGDPQLNLIMQRRNACIKEVEEFNATLTPDQLKNCALEF